MGYYIKKEALDKDVDDVVDEAVYEALADKFITLDQEHSSNTKGLLQALFDDLFSGSDRDIKSSEFDWGIEDDTAL